MTEQEIRKLLAQYRDELDAVQREQPNFRLRKVLLPAALGAGIALAGGCSATPIALPYMGPMPDGMTFDIGVKVDLGVDASADLAGPSDGLVEVLPDQDQPADQAVDGLPPSDAPRETTINADADADAD